MKFETVRIYVLSDILVCSHLKNFATMATWRNDVSSLSAFYMYFLFLTHNFINNKDKSAQIFCALNPCI